MFAILTPWKPKDPDENPAHLRVSIAYGDGVKPDFPGVHRVFPALQRTGTPDDCRKRRGISCGEPGLRQWAAFANYRRSTSLIFERVPEMVGRVKSIAAELDELQSLLIARTSGKRCTSAMKFASSGEVLSLFHASASGNGMFRSAIRCPVLSAPNNPVSPHRGKQPLSNIRSDQPLVR